MPAHLYIAPAGTGKTAQVVAAARAAAADLAHTPYVIVPTYLQVQGVRRRLAEGRGALGVTVLTFDRFCSGCLARAGEVYTELSEPVQYRLLRVILDGLSLEHYAPLRGQPGFVQVLQRLIAELKAATITPAQFTAALAGLEAGQRLDEIAAIYAAYEQRLRDAAWTDRAGLATLALPAIQDGCGVAPGSVIAVDGFASFTPAQLAVLAALAGGPAEVLVTLTGDLDPAARPQVFRRFAKTRAALEASLGVAAQPLPATDVAARPPLLARLAGQLYERAAVPDAGPCDCPATPPAPGAQTQTGRPQGLPEMRPSSPAPALTLIEAPDRPGEVRAALRWLKARLALDSMPPQQTALLVRAIEPYRPYVLQTAAEFGLSVRLVAGQPLRANPAIVGLLDLLRLSLSPATAGVPGATGGAGPALPRRLVLEAWRNPYFDWEAIGASDAPAAAARLDAAARWGQVIGGLDQWRAALAGLAAVSPAAADAVGDGVDDEQDLGSDVPRGADAQALAEMFERFVTRVTPPPTARRYRDYVAWLEDIIGADPDIASPRSRPAADGNSLRMVYRIRDGQADLAARDVAALQALKDVLRGLVWAEEALPQGDAISFTRFFTDLAGAIDATSYHLPESKDRAEILVADVVQARGLSFRAVALLGLAEGEFPARASEDHFLRDADRLGLAEGGLPIEMSTLSAEREYFYETLTRPAEKLLLTRPRISDNGASWPASPFWEEVLRLAPETKPQTLTSESRPAAAEIASLPELLAWLATAQSDGAGQDRAGQERAGAAWLAVVAAAHVLAERAARRADSAHDGSLAAAGEILAENYGAHHTWSASRLEDFRTCPLQFFFKHVLKLEPRSEPAAGLDARQLGTIYHSILEQVYRAAAPGYELPDLLAALPGVAAAVLDAAPRELGFRATAWWAQTRREIVANIENSLAALAEAAGPYRPLAFEQGFFREQSLLVQDDGELSFRLHGLIDRVDRDPAGRLRIIDYKTGGPSRFTDQAVAEGKKLQLPLYALAARDALRLGEVVDGWYWHVRQAQASPFSLAEFDGGPQAAFEAALMYARQTIADVRAGHFAPHPPADGCPSYCAAAGFCWHYRPGFGG